MFNRLAFERHGVLHGLERCVSFGVGQRFERSLSRHNCINDATPHSARHCFKLPETYRTNGLGLLKLMNRLGGQHESFGD